MFLHKSYDAAETETSLSTRGSVVTEPSALRGWRDDLVAARRAARRWVAMGIGSYAAIALVGPTLMQHGTPEQQAVAAGGCLRPPRLGAPVPPPPPRPRTLAGARIAQRTRTTRGEAKPPDGGSDAPRA